MTENRLSTTMRIEIPPELRKELRRNGTASPSGRRKIIRRVPARQKSDSGPIRADRYAAVNDANFQQLFQSVYDAALITDPRGDILDANTRAQEFFKSQRDDFINHSILELISGADESLIETLRNDLESARFALIEAFCQRFDGSLFAAEISVNRMQLTGKDYLCFFVRDITLRRQTEEMVRTVYNAIHNAGDGIAITDLAGKLEYVNPATAQLWGFPAAKAMLQMLIQDLWADNETVTEMIQLVLSGESWTGELSAQQSNGQTIPLQVSAAANHDTDEQLAGMVFSFIDISDRKRAEEMAREAERQRVMLESIGTACHHLGQPATVLLASLGMMQKQESSFNEELRALLHQGIESAEKLQTILHRLNAINEYRTVQYLDNQMERAPSDGDRILDL